MGLKTNSVRAQIKAPNYTSEQVVLFTAYLVKIITKKAL